MFVLLALRFIPLVQASLLCSSITWVSLRHLELIISQTDLWFSLLRQFSIPVNVIIIHPIFLVCKPRSHPRVLHFSYSSHFNPLESPVGFNSKINLRPIHCSHFALLSLHLIPASFLTCTTCSGLLTGFLACPSNSLCSRTNLWS